MFLTAFDGLVWKGLTVNKETVTVELNFGQLTDLKICPLRLGRRTCGSLSPKPGAKVGLAGLHLAVLVRGQGALQEGEQESAAHFVLVRFLGLENPARDSFSGRFQRAILDESRVPTDSRIVFPVAFQNTLDDRHPDSIALELSNSRYRYGLLKKSTSRTRRV